MTTVHIRVIHELYWGVVYLYKVDEIKWASCNLQSLQANGSDIDRMSSDTVLWCIRAVYLTQRSHIAFHLFTELSICSLCASPFLTCMVTSHLDNRQRHQQVSHDFSESVSDLLWSFGIFQVFICDEDVSRGGLEQEARSDCQISLWSWIVFLQRWIDKEDDDLLSATDRQPKCEAGK